MIIALSWLNLLIFGSGFTLLALWLGFCLPFGLSFCFTCPIRLAFLRLVARGYSVLICGVKTGAFENDTGGPIDFVQTMLMAFWANFYGNLIEALLAVKLVPAILAAVGVNWHGKFLG